MRYTGFRSEAIWMWMIENNRGRFDSARAADKTIMSWPPPARQDVAAFQLMQPSERIKLCTTM